MLNRLPPHQFVSEVNGADEQALTAQMYQDSAWNWGAWGPWGPSYRWGYGGRVGW